MIYLQLYEVKYLQHQQKSLSRLLQRIHSSSSGNSVCNIDTQSLVLRITQLLDKLHSIRQHILQSWHVRKLKLDQCFQLRLFEQDAEKVGACVGGSE